jgi:Ser/Thr protein kinase RdoA (MazF antagonist)
MSQHPFNVLTPEFIMDAVESKGFVCDGRILALNSYENRVYQIGLEDRDPLIAKFYRPERWSDEQILEEHAFCLELAEQELPVVPPMRNTGTTLGHFDHFRFALFERKGGRAPELDHEDNLLILGRLLARMHAIGARQSFQHRPGISIASYGEDSRDFILEHALPAELRPAYETLTRDLIIHMQDLVQSAGNIRSIRVHGDCHAGNMLWREDNPNFVDFDDARMAPSIQDIWMLLSGDRVQQSLQLKKILQGYLEFNDFDFAQLRLIEVFRTLRIMQYSAWLARRWHDPAFPMAFPWFNSVRYWEEHVLELREQLSALMEPPLYPAN